MSSPGHGAGPCHRGGLAWCTGCGGGTWRAGKVTVASACVFEDLVTRAQRDPAVARLILSGSQARAGMTTMRSDDLAAAAWAAGFGHVLDGWGSDLDPLI